MVISEAAPEYTSTIAPSSLRYFANEPGAYAWHIAEAPLTIIPKASTIYFNLLEAGSFCAVLATPNLETLFVPQNTRLSASDQSALGVDVTIMRREADWIYYDLYEKTWSFIMTKRK